MPSRYRDEPPETSLIERRLRGDGDDRQRGRDDDRRAPTEQPQIPGCEVLSWMGPLALEQCVDEQREMIGTDVAWAFQRAEGEIIGDEDVIQGPAETCR